jgi:2,3,4,5-tetrahydropyridine-2-carboxylate N-succinyltransferase
VSNPTPAQRRGAIGFGLATLAPDGRVLDTWYPAPELIPAPDDGEAGSRPATTTRVAPDDAVSRLGADAAKALGPDDLRGVEVVAVRTHIADLSAPPADTHDVWLRLHLLSHRLIQPHGASMAGEDVFRLLTNVAWTTLGPVLPAEAAAVRLRARAARLPFEITGVDKLPRMTDYVVPAGVRIADADRVRLGAHLAEGTTVMHEGFCNYNAGTLGVSMVEAGSAPASWSATTATSAAARRSWAPCPAAAPRPSASAAAACSAPTPASASASVTSAPSKPAST